MWQDAIHVSLVKTHMLHMILVHENKNYPETNYLAKTSNGIATTETTKFQDIWTHTCYQKALKL